MAVPVGEMIVGEMVIDRVMLLTSETNSLHTEYLRFSQDNVKCLIYWYKGIK
jgi:hypothetical protein